MPKTVRVYWGRHRGRVTFNFNWDEIDRTSTVLVSACEYRTNGLDVRPQDPDYWRFVGAATIRVANIAPHGPPTDVNRGVTFVVEIDWDDGLPVATDITVLDGPPVDRIHMENSSDL